MENNHKHDKKVCFDLLHQLSDYIDGNLNPQLCDDIEHHLENCENCTIVVDTLRKTIELYKKSALNEKMPEDVRSRLLTYLNLDDYVESNPSDGSL